MGWLQSLAAESLITLSDGTFWLSIGQGLLFGAVCLAFGVWLARVVGLLERDAPAGETLGVGLASGLSVLASWWAAVASGGRSSFTPVAIGFVVALALAGIRRKRSAVYGNEASPEPPGIADAMSARSSGHKRNQIVAVLCAAAFIVGIALLYGSTMAPSPRNGAQPVEFNDEAYYSVLGADLAKTGTETIYSPSGFSELNGLPPQTWYHWGELWIASAIITIFGTQPVAARYFVVLPILLFAAATLTGTIVRRMTGSSSSGAFLFGSVACLFLAPVALISGPFFSSFARGLIFGITTYGLAAVAILLAIYGFAVLKHRTATWTLSFFVGSGAAMILPDHIAIAGLAFVGVGTVWVTNVGRSLLARQRLPVVALVWRRVLIATLGVLLVSAIWGLLTGHGIGGSGLSPSVSPFSALWRESVVITVVSSGLLFAIAIRWFMIRKGASAEARLYFGTVAILAVGATAWGARFGDLSTVHLFFGGIVVFATPVAAVAAWSVWLRLRAAGNWWLAVTGIVLCVSQIECGVLLGVTRLGDFGRSGYPPIPLEILASIRDLPPEAKLAYACEPFEEVAFWDSRLIGLDAHTGRQVVPMCFEADMPTLLTDSPTSADIPNPLFQWAPQRILYPDSNAHPSPATARSFLKANGINYVYADALHPNVLVPDAVPIASASGSQILAIP